MNSIALEKVEIVLEPQGFLRIIFKDTDEDIFFRKGSNCLVKKIYLI